MKIMYMYLPTLHLIKIFIFYEVLITIGSKCVVVNFKQIRFYYIYFYSKCDYNSFKTLFKTTWLHINSYEAKQELRPTC